jgi:NuA3 HAT complex component NTO1
MGRAKICPFRSQDDIYLVLDNAIQYNKRDSPIHRTALRIKAQAERLLSELDQLPRRPPYETQLPDDAEMNSNEALRCSVTPSPTQAHPESKQLTIGDLEPPLSVLSLFTPEGSSTITDDPSFPLLLRSDPLTSLFSFEFEKLKPPPPPPSPPQRTARSKAKSKRSKDGEKPKRDRAAERERRLAILSSLDKAPGFRAPGPARTRGAKKALEAFEKEAGTLGDGGGEADAIRTNAVVVQDDSPRTDAQPGQTGEVNSDEAAMEVMGEAETEATAARDSEMDTSIEAEDAADAENSSKEPAPSKRSRVRSKRASTILPGHTTVPPVVDDVDNQRSFKMFDAGWILPAGQRRGGRAPIERKEREDAPRKKPRTGEFLF